jgi:hypothetical protein
VSIFRKISAGVLLTSGIFCLLVAAYSPVDKKINSEDKLSHAITFLVLGLPLTAGGACMVWGLRRDGQKQKLAQIDQIFFRLVEEGQGQITIMRFAKETQLTDAEAKLYLDKKAKAFNANFDVNPEGGVSYRFHL